ncbi:hypothetical protein PTI98_003765 [Pleurotus ostreatus]|nr:hypothetical protein PTI98_003765 [Pleurotus ostreatus]
MPSFLALALGALPAVFAATFDVSVGAGGQLAYDPPFVNAAPGDVVNFVFHPKNHTVTQSSFDTPCVALDGGKRSGFMPVAAETDGLPTFQFQVVDTTPAWFYCGQTGHCGQGMVFAVNPPAEPSPRSFTAFRDLAIATNGTASSSAAASSTASSSAATDGYVTPPAPHFETVTVTVTLPSSTYTTVYNSYDGTPPPTPAPQPQDHKITVGADGQLVYSPANIQAAIGDTVTFEFRPKNHTVTQSNFNNPCQPLFDTTGKVGFSSGFMPVSPDATQFPTFQIKINDVRPPSPTHFHCAMNLSMIQSNLDCSNLGVLWTDWALWLRDGVRHQRRRVRSQQLRGFPGPCEEDQWHVVVQLVSAGAHFFSESEQPKFCSRRSC